MADLTRRSTEPELMDSGILDRAGYERCLADLEAVNLITFTHRPTIGWLHASTRSLPVGTAVSVLDVACGRGDLLRAIHRWAARRGFNPVLTGIDLNPGSAEAARVATPAHQAITWHTGDIFDYTPDVAPDFVVSSQFTHHLDDNQVVAFLRWLEQHARRGWFIADLHRNVVPYYGFRFLARLMRWHPVVRIDGTISIARSFRRADWQRLIAIAGVPAAVRWHPMYRFCVARLRGPSYP